MKNTASEFLLHLRAEADLLERKIRAFDEFLSELPMSDAQVGTLKDLRESHSNQLYSTLEMISMVGGKA